MACRSDGDLIPAQLEGGRTPSLWCAMFEDRARLEPLFHAAAPWRLPLDKPMRLWTDDYSNLLGVMR
jgi:hypothetical protein